MYWFNNIFDDNIIKINVVCVYVYLFNKVKIVGYIKCYLNIFSDVYWIWFFKYILVSVLFMFIDNYMIDKLYKCGFCICFLF